MLKNSVYGAVFSFIIIFILFYFINIFWQKNLIEKWV